MSDLYRNNLDWAEKTLPNEYGPFVAVAYGMIEMTGTNPNKDNVLARLISSGRDRASCIERHKRYRG